MKTRYIMAFASVVMMLCGCAREELAGPEVLSAKDGVVNFAPSVGGIGPVAKAGYSKDVSGSMCVQSLSLTSEDGKYSLPMNLSVTSMAPVVGTKASLINENGGITDAEFAEAVGKTFWVSAWDDATTPAQIIPDARAKTFTDYVSGSLADGFFQKVMYRDGVGDSHYWMTVQPQTSTAPDAPEDADDEYIWKSTEAKKTFYAYANLPAAGSSIQVDGSGQTLTYAMPETAAAQADILLGFYTGSGKTGATGSEKMTGTAIIDFEHPLTSVLFKQGVMTGVEGIKSITISGLASSGSVKMGSDGDIGNWAIASDETYGSSASLSGDPLEVDEDTKVVGGESGAFLLIPQNLADHNVSVTVVLSLESGDDVTVCSDITAGVWNAGETNTYTLGYSATGPELLLGKFSVSPTEYVQFSRGNLYCTDNGSGASPRYVFSFEANQYDFRCRNGVANDGAMINGVLALTPPSTSGQFQWLTSNSGASEYDLACYGAFSELTKEGAKGLPSDVLNYGLCMGTGSEWYTLTKSEYDYLINSRQNADKLRKWCNVLGMNGLLLAPDVENTLSATPDYLKDYATKEAWKEATLAYNLVFLPATGYLCYYNDGDPGDELGVNGLGAVGYYYSSSADPNDDNFKYLAYYLDFYSAKTETGSFNRNYGRSVRLVQKFEKHIEPLPGYFYVSATKKVQFSKGNLYCIDNGEAASPRYTFAFEDKQYEFHTRYGYDHYLNWKSGPREKMEPSDVPGLKYEENRSGYFQWVSDNAAIKTSDEDAFNDARASFGAFSNLTSTDLAGQTTDVVDFGKVFGEDSPWFTLTSQEWEYFESHHRKSPSSGGNGVLVCGVPANIYAPTGWSGSIQQTYTASEWEAAEASGLVIIPDVGQIYSESINIYGAQYWSCTASPSDSQRVNAYFSEHYLEYIPEEPGGKYHNFCGPVVSPYAQRNNPNAVRLVRLASEE